jgi:hypothetical protein
MMKLPSLTKKPKYQQFRVEPRYYDPIKEDIENRTSRIKSEMGISESEDLDVGYSSQISGSFRKNMKHATGIVDQSSMLRLIILIILILFVGGFVYIGTEVFYLALLYIPFYLWKKFRK